MKSFKIVAVIIGLSVSALMFFSNRAQNNQTMVEDSVDTKAAAPKADIPL